MGTRGVVVVAVAVLSIAALAPADDTAPGAAETLSVAEQRATRSACIDACGDHYKVCMQRDEAKHPGTCGGVAVRCRQACPPKPTTVRSAQPARAVESAAAPAPPATNTKGENAAAMPAKDAAVPAARAAAPATAEPPKSAHAEHGGDHHEHVRADTPQAAAAAKPESRIGAEAPTATASQSAPATDTAVAPVQHSRPRNLAQTAWCLFRRCADDEDEPVTCGEACSDTYQRCVMVGGKREAQHCSGDLMQCRNRCGGGA